MYDMLLTTYMFPEAALCCLFLTDTKCVVPHGVRGEGRSPAPAVRSPVWIVTATHWVGSVSYHITQDRTLFLIINVIHIIHHTYHTSHRWRRSPHPQHTPYGSYPIQPMPIGIQTSSSMLVSTYHTSYHTSKRSNHT